MNCRYHLGGFGSVPAAVDFADFAVFIFAMFALQYWTRKSNVAGGQLSCSHSPTNGITQPRIRGGTGPGPDDVSESVLMLEHHAGVRVVIRCRQPVQVAPHHAIESRHQPARPSCLTCPAV